MNNGISNDMFAQAKWAFDLAWLGGLCSSTVCEVGIGPSYLSILAQFKPGFNCKRLIGIDPHPTYAEWARQLPYHVEVYEKAISDREGFAQLNLNNGSSALEGSWCPTPSNHAQIQVETIRFDAIDPGYINVLNLDCEGAEFHVLQQMKSKPWIIAVELWPQNPDTPKIQEWLQDNNYMRRFTTGPEGETQIWSK